MTKKTAVQMKDYTFSGIDRISLIALLQQLDSACHVYGIHVSTAIRLFMQFLTDPAETVLKAEVTLSNSATFYHDHALKSCSANVQFLLRC